jgi:hypothetical protein
MNPSGQKLLDLLFEPDEEVCVSPDSYGWMSIPLSEISMGSFVLKPQTDKMRPRFCTANDIMLVAINPIKGARRDENVTAYRSFLVELDDGNLSEQFKYVKDMKMPYSACVFSGSKSLHFAITLSKPLPSYDIWRYYAEWILAIMDRADQQTKNPSRSIRMAGNYRNDNEMKLIDIRGRIELEELTTWLSQYHGLAPREQERTVPSHAPMDILHLPEWVQKELEFGIDKSKGRNNRWFAIALQCGLLGWTEDDTISILDRFFQEERDFRRHEWLTAVRSGVKRARSRYD